MRFALKKTIVPLALVVFLAMAIFGFAIMPHGPDGQMPAGDCPFSVAGASICPQNTVAVAIHHISSYLSFISAPVGVNTLTLIVLLFVALALTTFSVSVGPPFQPPLARVFLYSPPPVALSDIKIKRWLSLFENSPSFS